jgi:hypothetical protein
MSRALRGVVIYDSESDNEDCFTPFAMTLFYSFVDFVLTAFRIATPRAARLAMTAFGLRCGAHETALPWSKYVGAVPRTA